MTQPSIPLRYLGLPNAQAELASAAVVVLPIPYDATTSYMPGARRGPQAIIDASRHLELLDDDSGRDASLVNIHTAAPLEVDTRGPAFMIERVCEASSHFQKREKFVLGLGGEHSVSLGLVQAARARFGALGVLQLDAHLDLRNQFEGSPHNHACVMRRIHHDLQRPITQVGIRSYSEEEQAYIQQHGLQPVKARALMRCGREQRQAQIEAIVDDLPQQVYLSVDLDVFDPAIVPATGTPEPGGLDWYTVIELLEAVARRRHIVAADIVELAPIGGQVASDFLAAKLSYKIVNLALLEGHRST